MRLKLLATIGTVALLAACAQQNEPMATGTTGGTPIYAKDGVTVVGYANDGM